MTTPTNNPSNTRPKRILNLLSHIPTFLFRFLRLISFVIVLLPAFIVFLWHYLTCDRIAVYYGDCLCDDKGTCGADISSEENEGNVNCNTNGNSPQCANGNKTRCKKCRPFRSRHYLDIYGSTSPPQENKKPVILFLTGGAYIIGYKMWGTLLARALSKHVLVIVPDYRNYPAVNIAGMVNDVDKSIDWVLNNVQEFGGDCNRVVLVGQSAGGHLGGIVVVSKVLDWLRQFRMSKLNKNSEDDGPRLKSSYNANQLCGFISTSSPHNLVTMRQVFHRHGLSCSVQTSIFGGSSVDGDGSRRVRDCDASSSVGDDYIDVFEKWSTFHLVKKCHQEYVALQQSLGVGVGNNSNNGDDTIDQQSKFALKDLFPKQLCIIHGTNDKTVPVEESIEFLTLLSTLQIPCQSKFYKGWTHTDPILEAPMRGNHLYHRDVYDFVRLWTCNENNGEVGSVKSVADGCNGNGLDFNTNHRNGNGNGLIDSRDADLFTPLPDLDEENDPLLQPICPKPLVEIARICNPF